MFRSIKSQHPFSITCNDGSTLRGAKCMSSILGRGSTSLHTCLNVGSLGANASHVILFDKTSQNTKKTQRRRLARWRRDEQRARHDTRGSTHTAATNWRCIERRSGSEHVLNAAQEKKNSAVLREQRANASSPRPVRRIALITRQHAHNDVKNTQNKQRNRTAGRSANRPKKHNERPGIFQGGEKKNSF